MAEAYHMTLKIILLGDYSVNKGTLLKALTSEPQQPGVTCLGFRSGIVELLFLRDGKRIRVKINDTAGQERFRSITSSYYRGAHGCMLLFDVTQKSTFEGLLEWHRELHTNSLTDDIAVTLVGCNCHVTSSERQVAPQTAQELADYLEVPYEELTAVNVHTVVSVLEPLIDRIVSNRMSHRASVVSLSMDSLSNSMMAERQRQETHRRICRC